MGPVFHIDDDVVLAHIKAKGKIYRLHDEARAYFTVLITSDDASPKYKKGDFIIVHRINLVKVARKEFAWE
jgi:phage repressor protein C with HTH and peptisase S24 domain